MNFGETLERVYIFIERVLFSHSRCISKCILGCGRITLLSNMLQDWKDMSGKDICLYMSMV